MAHQPLGTQPSAVRLVGFDFGSTTSGAMVAAARVLRNCVSGRMELGEVATVYRSEPVFTPFVNDALDEPRLAQHLDRWIAAAGIDANDVFSGGAIVTGLAAQASNAGIVERLVRERFGDALIATADDPGLESWLAFMGNTLGLSRAEPEAAFLNLDIGGGTTNLALGRAGDVRRVGCCFVGARHLRFAPGGYRLTGWSKYGERLLKELHIAKRPSDELNRAEIEAVLDFYVNLLEGVVRGDSQVLQSDCARLHEQVRFDPAGETSPVITFSGGVGELIYRHSREEPRPATTAYGDLGIDLACRICRSTILSRHLATHVPAHLGRATVYGLTIHNTEVSGSTLYLPRPEMLPLRDVPIVGRISSETDDNELRNLLELARRSARGACLHVTLPLDDWRQVKQFGGRLCQALRVADFPAGRPLVLLSPQNIGKTLGQYATDWGKLDVDLIAIDEVACRAAQFVHVGRPRHDLVPVSFFGLQSDEDGEREP